MTETFQYKSLAIKVTFLLLCFLSIIFHTKVNASLVDDLLKEQQQETKAQLERTASERNILIKNCRLPFKNQRQLIEDLSSFANVNPMTIKIISAEVWGVDDKLYCRAHIYHAKGLCKVNVGFDKSGALTSSRQRLRVGQCEF